MNLLITSITILMSFFNLTEGGVKMVKKISSQCAYSDQSKHTVCLLDAGRMYDPRMARFISPDPKSRKFPGSSPYDYASNNPVYNIDRNGESPMAYMFVPIDIEQIKLEISSYRYIQQYNPFSVELSIVAGAKAGFDTPFTTLKGEVAMAELRLSTKKGLVGNLGSINASGSMLGTGGAFEFELLSLASGNFADYAPEAVLLRPKLKLKFNNISFEEQMYGLRIHGKQDYDVAEMSDDKYAISLGVLLGLKLEVNGPKLRDLLGLGVSSSVNKDIVLPSFECGNCHEQNRRKEEPELPAQNGMNMIFPSSEKPVDVSEIRKFTHQLK